MSNLKKHLFNQVLFLLTMLFAFGLQLKAQVTIGSIYEPQSGALLDLKETEITNPGDNTPNSSRGILFPKVSLQSAKSLEPLISSATDIQKKTSKGMIVYNVNSSATELTEGLCVWTGEEWNAVIGGGPSTLAEMDINCSGQITVSGNYIKGNALGPYTNTITLPVTVSRAGTYNIAVYSEPYNDYYFEANGEFPKTGNFNVTLNGVGRPLQSTVDRGDVPDKLKIVVNKLEYAATCSPSLTVPELEIQDVAPNYYFSCNDVSISNVDLTSGISSTGSHVTVRVQAPEEVAGARYHIETNTVNGIKFEGSGELYGGQQWVALSTDGTVPPKGGVYNFYLTSNSTDPRGNNCSFDVLVKGRTVKVAIWGNTVGQYSISKSDAGAFKMLTSSALFGLGVDNNPVYPVDKIDIVSSSSLPSLSGVDILISSYSANPSGTDATSVSEFINKGGVVIHCLESGGSLDVPNSVFGSGVISLGSSSSEGTTYISLGSGSPLTEGTYDIAGKNVGYDGGFNLGYAVNGSSNVEIVGTRVSDGTPAIIRHKTKPYVMLGDGAIFCGPYISNNNGPVAVTSGGLPEVRTNYGYSFGAYNAHLFANIMIWAIRYRLSL